MGAIGDLALVPGVVPQLGADRRIGDHQKLPGLQAIAGCGEHKGLLEAGPGGGIDLALCIKSLGGVAPLQRVQKSVGAGEHPESSPRRC